MKPMKKLNKEVLKARSKIHSIKVAMVSKYMKATGMGLSDAYHACFDPIPKLQEP